jgi:hypothetical protein
LGRGKPAETSENFQLFSQKGKIQKESMSPYTRPFSSSDILEGITNNFDQQENKW